MGLRQFPRLAASTPPAKSIEQIAKHSSSMRKQSWETYRIKDTNKGPEVWEVKACAFYQKRGDLPSQRLWLIVAHHAIEGTLKYFLSNAPQQEPLQRLLRIAFSRWRVERCFEDAKGELGMDHFEVRRWLSILASRRRWRLRIRID